MLIGHFQLFLVMLSTFLIAAIRTNLHEQVGLLVLPIQSLSAANPKECPESCSIDYCFKYASITRNCTRLIRDQCDCCTVCLRTENQICGGHLNVYGLCEQDLLCYQSSNTTERTGICVKACLKFQCLPIMINDSTTCECANRRVPCHADSEENTTSDYCEEESLNQQKREFTSLKSTDAKNLIDCSNIVCTTKPLNSSNCPVDSHLIEDHTPLFRTQSSSTKNLSSVCCEPRGQCVCSSCPKTICGENSIIQIYRTGNPSVPGQCCDQFDCIKNSKQCHHDKKIYSENETWAIDHCTDCTCRSGLVSCTMVQCPTYSHCGYMYKPENECCPKCGGCLNDQFQVQHMNSTWFESNGCVRCWCANGQSQCIAQLCIAPPCENPRQIANVCCPVCDDPEDQILYTPETDSIITSTSELTTKNCPQVDKCLLVCEHGLAKDEQGCVLCACSTISCPSPLCTLKVDRFSKQYCSCQSPIGINCGTLNCDKHCPYDYALEKQTACPICECNLCPLFICPKNCTYGLKHNAMDCPICVCESNLTTVNQTKTTGLISKSWPRQCHSGLFSYSNGEIWFDGCRQCFCHKGEQLCTLISCPTLKCAQPILLPNRCCPSCPGIAFSPEPIPSPQICYASQYVTGEELEFDNCTKCICLHNIAFCTVSLCPPLRCSSPVYEESLCCPICPPEEPKTLPGKVISNLDGDVCLLENGMTKRAGELWKQDDCRSCLCPRGGGGHIECFSQTCVQELRCSNPVLKKGQCCSFCLPPTSPVNVCIFNYAQYRSGEHWNVSECHHCECSYGTIICHQHKCPSLTCVHTVTLSGHCCPICRDQLLSTNDQGKLLVPISQSRFGLTIIVIFSVLTLILILIILTLIFILLRGRHRSLSPADQFPTAHHRSPTISHHATRMNSKPSNQFSYVKYDLMSISNDNTDSKQALSSSSHIPLTSLEQTSTHSMIGTNTTTGTDSSNHELEPGTWNEDEPMLQRSASTSNTDDDEVHETTSSDNDESRQQQSSHPQIHMTPGPPTIIYV